VTKKCISLALQIDSDHLPSAKKAKCAKKAKFAWQKQKRKENMKKTYFMLLRKSNKKF
jgi:hypothetical protein